MSQPHTHTTGGLFRDVLRDPGTVSVDTESAKAESGPKVRLKKFSVGDAGKGHDVFIGDEFIGKVWEIQDGGKTKYQVQQRKNNKWQSKSKKFDSRMLAVEWLKDHYK